MWPLAMCHSCLTDNAGMFNVIKKFLLFEILLSCRDSCTKKVQNVRKKFVQIINAAHHTVKESYLNALASHYSFADKLLNKRASQHDIHFWENVRRNLNNSKIKSSWPHYLNEKSRRNHKMGDYHKFTCFSNGQLLAFVVTYTIMQCIIRSNFPLHAHNH